MQFTRTFINGLSIAALLTGLALAAQPGDELAIGAKGPDFNLKGTDGKMHSLASSAGAKGTAVVFTCNECPYSKGYEDRLIETERTTEHTDQSAGRDRNAARA